MSNDINNNWIEAIKQKADQATRDVPEGMWQAIAKSLPEQKQAPIPAKRAIVAPRMWKGIAAAAAVAIAVTTGFFLINDNNPEPKRIAQMPTAPIEKPATEPVANTVVEETTPDTSPTLIAQDTPSPAKAKPAPSAMRTKGTPAKNSPRHYKDEYVNEDQFQLYPEEEEEELLANEFNPDEYFYDIETMQALEELYAEYDNAMNQDAMQPWSTYTDSTYQQHLIYDANARRAAREKMAIHNRNEEPTMAMAAYGNGLISGDRNTTVNGSSSALLSPAASGNPGMMLAPAAPGMAPNVAPPVNYEYHHHMPITVGLTLSKRIVGNLYGNVGLNFTSMSSDVTPDNGAPEFKQNIKLVGLPFGVKWNFWRYKGLSTFIGGEGLVERVVSAKFNNESLTIKRLQWSVHATAGLQYNFTSNIGIYVQPKLSHYITTMPLNTQRNEHPLNFNLQMGLSIDF